MKIRFQAPTEAFPFFHGVRVQTSKGWQKVKAKNDRLGGWDEALFPSKEEMIRGVKRAVRAEGA